MYFVSQNRVFLAEVLTDSRFKDSSKITEAVCAASKEMCRSFLDGKYPNGIVQSIREVEI